MSLVKGCCFVNVNINVREGLESNNGESIFCGIITFITHKKKKNKAGNKSGEAAREVTHEVCLSLFYGFWDSLFTLSTGLVGTIAA